MVDAEKLQDLYNLIRKYSEDLESGIFLKQPILAKFLVCFKDQKLFADLRLGLPLEESRIAQVVLHILDQNIRYHLNQATCFERTKTADFAYQMREYADIFGENLTTRKEYKELIRITDAFVQEKAGVNFATIVDLSKKTGISWKRLCDENLRPNQVKINKEIVSALSKGWLYLDDTKLFQESINESLDSLLSGNTEKARDIMDVIKAKYVDVFRERTFFDPVYNAWGKIFRKPKNINAIDITLNGSKTFELIKNVDEEKLEMPLVANNKNGNSSQYENTSKATNPPDRYTKSVSSPEFKITPEGKVICDKSINEIINLVNSESAANDSRTKPEDKYAFTIKEKAHEIDLPEKTQVSNQSELLSKTFDKARLEAIENRFSINLTNSIYDTNATEDSRKFTQNLYNSLNSLEKLKLPQAAEKPYVGSVRNFAIVARNFEENNEIEKATGIIYVMKQVGIFFDGFFNHAKERGMQELVSYVPARLKNEAIVSH